MLRACPAAPDAPPGKKSDTVVIEEVQNIQFGELFPSLSSEALGNIDIIKKCYGNGELTERGFWRRLAENVRGSLPSPSYNRMYLMTSVALPGIWSTTQRLSTAFLLIHNCLLALDSFIPKW
jgi:hypothetical protein